MTSEGIEKMNPWQKAIAWLIIGVICVTILAVVLAVCIWIIREAWHIAF